MDRPTLNDPAEYALIKKIHFNDDTLPNKDLDPIEELERSNSRSRNQNNSSR